MPDDQQTFDFKYDKCKPPSRDLVGFKSDRLLVQSFLGRRINRSDGKGRGQYWLCLCDCGETVEAYQGNLLSRHTNSCGCRTREACSILGKSSKDKSKFASSVEFVASKMYINYTASAKKKGRTFEIPWLYWLSVVQEACDYCGTEGTIRGYSKGTKGKGKYISARLNGVDRIDSSRGYSVDNVVPCCRVCNFQKRDLSESEFLSHIEKIYLNQRKQYDFTSTGI